MFKYHHIYTFFASSGIANQIFECRILRRYDAANKPDWVNEFIEPRELTSAKDDMTIDWARGNDVYAPMLGSKFDFSLINVGGKDFDDFADGDFKEYRVDVINLIPDGSIIYDKWGNGSVLNHYSVVRHVPGRVLENKIAETTRPGYKAQLYWRGFIHPVNSKEPILAPPFNVKYTAVDGLAELGERTMPFLTHKIYRHNERQLRLIEVIQYTLEQTKTDLDIAINSGIEYIDEVTIDGEQVEVKYDSIYDSYVSVDSFYNKKLIDVVKGILTSFNCRLLQSNGYWYIFNPSLINSYNDPNAPSTVNGITWKIYQYTDGRYVEKVGADTDTDKQLRRSVNGQRSDLIPMESTLTQIIQQPVKSIECKPNTLHSINEMENPFFALPLANSNPSFGWEPYNSNSNPLLVSRVDAPYSSDQTLTLATQKEFPFLMSPALMTNRVVAEINSTGDIWAINTSYSAFQSDRNITVEIKAVGWFTEDLDRTPEISDARTLGIFGDISIPYSILINGILYDFQDNLVSGTGDEINFRPGPLRRVSEIRNKEKDQTRYINRLKILGQLKPEQNRFEFQAQSVELNLIDSFRAFGTKLSTNLSIYVIFWYPQVNGNIIQFKNDPANGYPNDNNIVGKTQVLIDSVSASVKIPNEILNPTFTRIQAPFRRKETYTPYVVQESDVAVSQKINNIQNQNLVRLFRANTFNDDDTSRDTKSSLEQIVTQLKLNDFRRRAQIFEGNVASNHNGYPIFPIQMIDVDFRTWKSGRLPREQSKAEATIFWGGRYNLSTGIFTISTFTPNQFTDISPENRADIDTPDFDDDGQLLPGYYTNSVTAFRDLPERTIIDTSPPEPVVELPPAATEWYHNSPNFIHIQEPERNVYIKDIRTNGAFTLRGEIYVGNNRELFGLTEDKGYKKIDINPYIVKGTKHLASFNLIFNCPVDGNENTKEIEIEFGSFEVIPNILIEKEGANNLISFLNQINPDNTNLPATRTYHSQNSITGERVEVQYHRALVFIRAHSRTINAEGVETVTHDPISTDKSNAIVISYEGRYLTIPEIPDVPLGITTINRDLISIDFSGGSARSVTIDLNDENERNKSLTIDVTVTGADFTDIQFHALVGTTNINNPVPGVSILPVFPDRNFPAIGQLRILIDGYNLEIGRDLITASIVGSWGGVIITRGGTVTLNISVQNERSFPDFQF